MAIQTVSWKRFDDNIGNPMTSEAIEMEDREHQANNKCSLHKAVRESDVELVEEILKEMLIQATTSDIPLFQDKILRRRLNAKDHKGWTAFHYAAQKNNKDICQLLYDYSKLRRPGLMKPKTDEESSQLEVLSRNNEGATPFHLVAQGNRLSLSEKLGDLKSVVDPIDHYKKCMKQQICLQSMLQWLDRVQIEDVKDSNGRTPLHWACQRNNTGAVLQMLLFQPPKVQVCFTPRSPLMRKFHPGQCNEINEALLHCKDNYKQTPLHICAIYHANETAKVLLQLGAVVTNKDKYGSTPLHRAVSEGNHELSKYILEDTDNKHGRVAMKKLIETCDATSHTALHVAALKGFNESAQLLIAKGNDDLISQIDSKGNTALHHAARLGSFEIIKLLIESGISVSHANSSGMTALHIAVKFNRHHIVGYLVEKGASVNARAIHEMTPLLLSAYHGHVEILKYLMQKCDTITDDDAEDRTLLHLAAEANQTEIIKTILCHQHGKSLINKVDHHGYTPLHVTALRGYHHAARLLLEHEECNINIKTEKGKSAIHLAAKRGHMKLIELILQQHEAQLHAKDKDGNTPLIAAARHGQVATIQRLIKLGSSLDDKNSSNYTALASCGFDDFTKSAKVLIEAGATMNFSQENVVNPIHVACKHGSPNMVTLLLKSGASVVEKDEEGNGALDLAVKHGHKKCAKVIIQSDKWKAAMRSAKYDSVNRKVSTPLREMIKTMPDVAELVFFRCTKISPNIGLRDEKYNVQFDFEFLDDDYTSASWKNLLERGESEINQEKPLCFEDSNVLDGTFKPYCDDNKVLERNHPLAIMSRQKNAKLLVHPLVSTLLRYKWTSFGRPIYYTLLTWFCAFLAFLTLYFISLPPPYAVYINGTGWDACFIAKKPSGQLWESKDCDCCRYGNTNVYFETLSILILVMAVISLLKEVFQIVQSRQIYFKQLDNYVEVISYTLAIAVVINWTERSAATGVKESWQWEMAAVCLFTSWLNLALFVRKLPTLGIYVIMALDVFKTFLKFFVTFAIFLVGCSLLFYMLLQNQVVFHTWWQSLLKTTVMTVGELDFGGIFYSEQTQECEENSSDCYSSTAVYYPEITYVIFGVFLMIMPIVVMNLLVGLAVDDIKVVQEQATMQKLAKQIKLALDVEYMIPEVIRKRTSIGQYTIYPNKYRKKNWFIRFLNQDEVTTIENIAKSLLDSKEIKELMLEQHEQTQKHNKKIGEKLSDLLKQTEKLNKQVLLLAKQYGGEGNDVMKYEEDTN